MPHPSPRLADAHSALGTFLVVVGALHFGLGAWVVLAVNRSADSSPEAAFAGMALVLVVGALVAIGIGGADLAAGRRLREGAPGGREMASGLLIPNLAFGVLGMLAVLVDVAWLLGG